MRHVLKRTLIVSVCSVVFMGLVATAAMQGQKDPLETKVVFENARVKVTQYNERAGRRRLWYRTPFTRRAPDRGALTGDQPRDHP
jgi:hypothetical protein